MRYAAVFLVLLLTAAVQARTPADAVRSALADARSLSPDVRVRTRYFWLGAVPDKSRPDFLKAFNYHVHSLSREAELVEDAPRRIAPDVLAVIISDYQWDTKTYERLAEAGVEPYFHAVVETEETYEEKEEYGNWWYNGRVVDKTYPGAVWRTTHTKTVKKTRKSKQNAAAPWLPTKEVAELILLTQSQVPIVRADWFLVQTGIARKDSVSYYDFLGLGKKEKDFEKLIGADPEVSRRVRREIAAVLGRSGVAVNNRRVVRLQSVTGAYYLTDDFNTSKNKQNVLRFLDGDTEPPDGDASERYGVLPNGLFAYWLQNAKGERQDIVPPTIALDSHTSSNDRNIYGGIKSCTSCHVEGIRPINDYARKTYRNAVKLQSADYDRFLRLRQLYLSDLEGQVKADQEYYGRVLLRLNGAGWTPARNAKTYEATWDAYVEEDWTLERLALATGYPKAVILAALKREVTLRGQIDPLLAGYLQDPEVPLRSEHVEEIFGTLMTILLGYSP